VSKKLCVMDGCVRGEGGWWGGGVVGRKNEARLSCPRALLLLVGQLVSQEGWTHSIMMLSAGHANTEDAGWSCTSAEDGRAGSPCRRS
jgi:hypothetical protein